MIYWFTGQPSTGKTTLANMLKKEKYYSQSSKKQCFTVDGDDLRNLFDNKDYSEKGRRDNVLLAQRISLYLHTKGFDVIVSLVSPYKDIREAFKEKLGMYIREFYIHCTDPRERDSYRVKDYESPTENFIDIDTTYNSPKQSLMEILKKI